MNNANGMILAIINFAEKFIQVYVDYLAKTNRARFKPFGGLLLSIFMTAFTLLLFSIALWFVIMATFFIYLQSLGINILIILSGLILVNGIGVIICITNFINQKDRVISWLDN